ncbi:hypothetical protein VTK73DRAFT_7841 [Phialemonium thermophilum]|uniref:Rhodopsin domain-containing protein n=1 Tax=Phialemonium thermophilum TaxID=223376 RepID=A0ABR3WCS4_9PEZI
MATTDDEGPRILISTWVLIVLSAVFVLARILCKYRAGRGLWWDDHVLIISWFTFLASAATITWSVPHGLGKHIAVVPPELLGPLGLVGNVTGSLSILAAAWSKTSFGLTLLRLMRRRHQHQRNSIDGAGAAGVGFRDTLASFAFERALLIVLLVSVNVAMGLNALFVWVRCRPVAKTWDFGRQGSCWAPEVYPTYGMFAAGYSAAADFLLALLPWRIIWSLQMKAKEKFGVAIAMSMGIFAGATSVVKTMAIPALSSGDFTYHLTDLVIWGAAESAVTIIAASIPVLRTLFVHRSTAGGGISTVLRRQAHGCGTSESLPGTAVGPLSRDAGIWCGPHSPWRQASDDELRCQHGSDGGEELLDLEKQGSGASSCSSGVGSYGENMLLAPRPYGGLVAIARSPHYHGSTMLSPCTGRDMLIGLLHLIRAWQIGDEPERKGPK